MTRWAIADTGPLVAYLDRRDDRHEWAVRQMSTLRAPILVCEPVLTEAMYLLSHQPQVPDALLDLLESGVLQTALRVEDQIAPIRALMRKYADLPMSFADACSVRAAELHRHHHVLTIDSHFTIYRKFGREAIPLIAPPVR